MLTRDSTELTDPEVVPPHWRNSHQSGPMPLAGPGTKLPQRTEMTCEQRQGTLTLTTPQQHVECRVGVVLHGQPSLALR